MKKRTSKKAILLRSILLLPLVSFLLYGFSETIIIQKEADPIEARVPSEAVEDRVITSPEQKRATNEQVAEYNTLAEKYHKQPKKSRIVSLKDLKILGATYGSMTPEQQQNASPFPEYDLKTEMIQIEIDQKGAIRSAGNSLTIESLPKFLKKYNAELSKEEREKSVRAIIKVADNTPKSIIDQVEQLLVAYGVAQINIEGPMTSSLPQDGASVDQIKEYNAIVKRINDQPENRRIYKKKEVERLEYIFGLMTAQQKQNAEPYPDFPPMPEPPAPPAPKEATPPNAIRAPKQPVGIRIRTAPVAPEAPEAPEVPEIEEPVLIHVEEIEEVEAPEAPEPPESPEPPMSPLDHVIEMAKADATFYYEGKKISSDKAIEILKKNESVNIDINGKDGKRPVVKLSKDPL